MWSVNERLLRDPASFFFRTNESCIEAIAYLANVIDDDQKLRRTDMAPKIVNLLRLARGQVVALGGPMPEEVAINLHAVAPVGFALFHIGGRPTGQLRSELVRFLDKSSLFGNYFLFHVAATLAASGHEVSFVKEDGKHKSKTPDLCATFKDGRRVFVECVGKRPNAPMLTPDQTYYAIHGAIDEKKLKFAEKRFAPGAIAIELSTTIRPDADGTLNTCNVRPELWASGNDRMVYPVDDDPEFFTREENRQRGIRFAVEAFRNIDPDKYHVTQCLIALTTQRYRVPGGVVMPMAHALVVDPSALDSALTVFTPQVFAVRRRRPE